MPAFHAPLINLYIRESAAGEDQPSSHCLGSEVYSIDGTRITPPLLENGLIHCEL
jgi:hypothetical protein